MADALPDGVDILADANEKCDLARAQWLVNALADVNALWLEEPLPAHDTNGLIKLRQLARYLLQLANISRALSKLPAFKVGRSIHFAARPCHDGRHH